MRRLKRSGFVLVGLLFGGHCTSEKRALMPALCENVDPASKRKAHGRTGNEDDPTGILKARKANSRVSKAEELKQLTPEEAREARAAAQKARTICCFAHVVERTCIQG